MKRRSYTHKIKKYTALVPRTMRATKIFGKTMVNKLNYFLKKTKKTVKNTTKYIDRKTAKSIGSLTKKRNRK